MFMWSDVVSVSLLHDFIDDYSTNNQNALGEIQYRVQSPIFFSTFVVNANFVWV